MSEELPSISHRVQSIQDWLQQEDEELLYSPDLPLDVECYDAIDGISGDVVLTWTSNVNPTTFQIPDYHTEYISCIQETHHPKKSFLSKLQCLYSFGAVLIYINIAIWIPIFLMLCD